MSLIGIGSDYKYAQAMWADRKKKATSQKGHMGSINPDTGEMLKKKSHPTYDKGIKGESEAGNVVGSIRGNDISVPSKRFKNKKRNKK